jgi:TRAP-type C4-dicarboxylate transport system substrate-binding protein
MTMADGRVRYATVHRYLVERLGEDGLVLLYAVPRPPQGLLTRAGFPGPDEWRGLTISATGAGINRLGELAGLKIVPPAEPASLIGELAAGHIDGVIVSAEIVPSVVQSAQRLSPAPVGLEWHDYAVIARLNIAIANHARLELLSDGDRAALVATARAVEERSWSAADQSYRQFKRLMESHGIRIVAPRPEDAARLARLGRVIADEWAVGLGLDGRSIIDAIGLAASSR